jgi:hypothetical protein
MFTGVVLTRSDVRQTYFWGIVLISATVLSVPVGAQQDCGLKINHVPKDAVTLPDLDGNRYATGNLDGKPSV